MGYHYIPRYYLKGFSTEENREQIFRYQIDPPQCIKTNIKNVAQETNFYSDDTEKFLAEDIEDPAKIVFEKIDKRHNLSDEDKNIFTDYLLAILKRVPSFYDFVFSKYPNALEIVKSKAKQRFLDLLYQNEITQIQFDQINEAIENSNSSVVLRNLDFQQIWEENIPPEMTPLIREEIFKKRWLFLTCKQDMFYITCDNPFFFDKSSGLKNSEITIPISKHTSLIITQTNFDNPNYAIPRTQLIKEINRRSISNAKDYIFSPQEADWIPTIINKRGNIFLNRISFYRN